MQTIEVCLELGDLVFGPPVHQPMYRLFSRKSSTHNGDTQKDSVRNRKKVQLEQKRTHKKQQISFLTKTYLNHQMSVHSGSERRISKGKIRAKDNSTPMDRYEEIDFTSGEKPESAHQFSHPKTPGEYERNKLGLQARKRDAQSAVSRSVVYPKYTIQVPNSNYFKEAESRKTSSTSKKMEQVPILDLNTQKNLNIRPIKSVPFMKQPRYYSCLPETKCLCEILEENGFVQHIGMGGIVIRWTENECLEEYDNAQKREIRYYNHIKNNPLLSKVGLQRVYKLLYEQNCKPYTFMPRMYSHKEGEEYIKDFELNCVLILLDKHIHYCQTKEPMFGSLEKLGSMKRRRRVNEEGLEAFVGREGHAAEKRENYLVNMHVCLTMLKVLEEQRYRRMDSNKPGEERVDERQYRNLIRFSKLPPTYDQYARNQFSNIHYQREPRSHSRSKESRWQTPSLEMVMKLLFYKDYFVSIYPQGRSNLWTMSCPEKKSKVWTKEVMPLEKGAVIWKHLENPWTASRGDGQTRGNKAEENILVGNTFEMIQPILIKSVDPLTVYIYSECYYKVFRERTHEADLEDEQEEAHAVHYISEREFVRQVMEFSPNYPLKQIKSRVSTFIKGVIKLSSMEMTHISGCFQLLDFHIILDQQTNPWLSSISKTSIIEKKAPSMTQYYSGLLLNTMRIVMPKEHFKTEAGKEKSCWLPLLKQRPNGLVEKMWLEVHGKKVVYAKKVPGEDNKPWDRNSPKEIKHLSLLQRKVREYLLRHK